MTCLLLTYSDSAMYFLYYMLARSIKISGELNLNILLMLSV